MRPGIPLLALILQCRCNKFVKSMTIFSERIVEKYDIKKKSKVKK